MRAYRPKPRLTIQELRPIVEFYCAHLPTWKVFDENMVAREDGPIVQAIAFERLSGGIYRPTGHIRVLVAPEDVWPFELPQYLNINVREISRREHPEFRDRVLEAIRAEFVPSVDGPLVAEEVLKLYEEKALPTDPEAYSLAALNAYLGHDERALIWCSRFTELVDGIGRPWQDGDFKRRAFLDQLEKWIKSGSAKEQLERVLKEERHKWGLARFRR